MTPKLPVEFGKSVSDSDKDQPFDVKDLVSANERPSGLPVDHVCPVKESDATTSPKPYFGQENFPPAYELQKEEPQHRVICLLAAQGFTTTEIAEQTGYTVMTIGYVKKQPWALQYIAALQDRAGFSIVKNVLQGAAIESAKTLIEVMRGYEVNEQGIKVSIGGRIADRAKAANAILDRLYGVAPQTVLHGKVDLEEMSTEELQQIVMTGETKTNK